MPEQLPFKRVLLKLSGEILLDGQQFGINPKACNTIALAINGMKETGIEIAIVIGGGNIFRGMQLKSLGMRRSPADHMGMLATLMNGIALKEALESINCKVALMTALECPKVAESYTWRRAQELLSQGHVVIFVGGTGNPYFTTDTAAALRACEIHADALLKATKVDGIYDKDPKKYPDAQKYDAITYTQALAQKLEVMDATSLALCMSNKIPILVFNMEILTRGQVGKVLQNPYIGTLVKES